MPPNATDALDAWDVSDVRNTNSVVDTTVFNAA
jgi:hypothetical protein